MKKVDKEVLKNAANKLMFDMNDKELDTLLEEFEIIQKQMQLIADIPGVDEAIPMTFPYLNEVSYLRKDVASQPLDRDVALANAGNVVDGQIRLPKVVG